MGKEMEQPDQINQRRHPGQEQQFLTQMIPGETISARDIKHLFISLYSSYGVCFLFTVTISLSQFHLNSVFRFLF